MKTRLLIFVLVSVFTGSLQAEEKVVLPSKFGVGYASAIGALGGRYWYRSNYAVDLGFGYRDDSDRTILSVTAGWVQVLQNTKQCLLEVRWGTSYRTSLRNLAFGVILMVEYFPIDSNRFSLSSGVGPHVVIRNLGKKNQSTDSETLASTLVDLGFHYYF